MKIFYSLVITCFLTVGLFAQNDTLLWQNFQDTITNMLLEPELDSVGLDYWVNWDSDGKMDANDRAQNWDYYWDFYQQDLDTVPPADTNTVYGSSSWLDNLDNGNRNWLITPPIVISDDQAMLHFKSAPFQGPRYMDGYSVLISTVDFFPFNFLDTLFRHKQMIPPLPDGADDINVNALNVDSFLFMPTTYLDYTGTTQEGYIHDSGFAAAYTSWDSVTAAYTAILEPHSFSLAQYSGQTIWIAFLHDSDDDNLISIDDILVTGNVIMVDAEEPLLNVRYMLYPNPATHVVNLSYRFTESVDHVAIMVYNVQGKAVIGLNKLNTSAGEYTHKVDVRNLPAGHYSVVLSVDNRQVTKNFIKK